MSKTVFCQKLKQELQGLDSRPLPGDFGDRLYNHISKQAWNMWLEHQTMLINENRLNLADPQAQSFLKQEMEKFFFGQGSDKPAGYVPPEHSEQH
jgi:Fe-S cluster biosynthesis and repair protein YggX